MSEIEFWDDETKAHPVQNLRYELIQQSLLFCF
jgi:hypothetical protein